MRRKFVGATALPGVAVAGRTQGRLPVVNGTGGDPPPTEINVSTASQLLAAMATVNAAGGNRTIVLADGTYTMTDALFVNVPNVTIRSASGVRANVIIQGDAISGSANVLFNARIDSTGFLAQNLTFGGRCRFSAIQIVGEDAADNGRLSNCIIRDSFEHLLKSSTNNTRGAHGWIIEDCLFTFTSGMAPAQYNGGIDVHLGNNWIVRRNTFSHIASPVTSACQHAVNFWNGSASNLIERNKVIDCDRGLGSGLAGNPANNGDIIRNNMCYHSANSDPYSDVQIAVENSINAKVYNNTVYTNFSWAMEYRFTTTGSEFRNNLCNATIFQRDGASATLANNITNAQASYFVGLSTGDLRLASSVSGVVNAGATLASVVDDYSGTIRPIGAGYDIGADEYIGDPLDLPLLNTSQIEYLGMFLLPLGAAPSGGEGFKFYPPQGCGAIAYNPANNSLFIAALDQNGQPGQMHVAEVSIVAAKTSAFNRSVILQNFTPACGGNQHLVETGSLGNVITGLHVQDGRLFIYVAATYLTLGNQTKSVFVRSSTNLSTSSVSGPYAISSANQRYVGGGAGCTVPVNWRPTFGGFDAVCGGGGNLSIASKYSNGPTLIFYTASTVTGSTSSTIPGNGAVYFPSPDTLGSFDGPPTAPVTLMWTGMSSHRGTIMLPGYRTILAFGMHGEAHYSGQTLSTGPMRDRFWLLDARDVKDAFDGSIAHDAAIPYAVHDMNFSNCDNGAGPYDEDDTLRGSAWDPDNNLLYVVVRSDGGSSYPAVHVLRINV